MREADLDKHLKNDTNGEDKQKDDKDKKQDKDDKKDKDQTSDKKKSLTEVPSKVDEEDDSQLQRAIDLLKSWKIFKKLPEAS